jgi:hypothetical protein
MSEAICARPGCERLTAARHGFCLPDWRSIPLDVQRAIWRSYREHDADVHADFLRRLGERLNVTSGSAPWPTASPSERMLR